MLRSSYEDLIKEGKKYPFRPGMTASVEIITSRKTDVLSVPLAAVTTRNPKDNTSVQTQEDQGNNNNNERQVTNSNQKPVEKVADKVVVFVNENGVAKMLEVKTGVSDYDNVEILSGVNDGAEVITGPFLVVSKRIKDGDKIKKTVEKKETTTP